MYHHQDWEPVVWKKKKEYTPPQQLNYKKEEDDIKEIKHVDKITAQKIIEARIKKKMTRKQLANFLNIAEKFIEECETCKTRPNEKIMNKIMNFVNKTLC